MPEVFFLVRLPDGVTKECYSPSTVVRDHFTTGEEMTVAEFLARSRVSLTAADARVRAKFGFGCAAASAQLADIERWTHAYPDDGTVRILEI